MTEVILHPQTNVMLDAFIAKPVHGILLVGSEGAGKFLVSKYLAGQLLKVNISKLEDYPYLKILSPILGTIKIDQIREIKAFLQLKTIGTSNIRRVCIIKDAHLMNIEAQNAMLKSLEEPPPDTVIILTATRADQLKQTVVSRIQQVQITPVGKTQLKELEQSQKSDDESIDRAFLLSGGKIGSFVAILSQSNDITSKYIEQAKGILKMSKFDRLNSIDSLLKDAESISGILEALKLLVASLRDSEIRKSDLNAVKKWHKAHKEIVLAEASLKYHPNLKLLLSNLYISI